MNVRRTFQSAVRHPVLLAPAGTFILGAALVTEVSSFLPAISSAISFVFAILGPAFIAWWLGMAWQVAEGRRVLLRDVWEILIAVAPMVYLLLFVISLLPLALDQVFGSESGFVYAVFLFAMGPWVDLMAAGGRRVDEAARAMRSLSYWGAAVFGLLMAAVPAIIVGFALAGLSLPNFSQLVDLASLPMLSVKLGLAVAAGSLLLVFREALLQDAVSGHRRARWPNWE